jgi:hypothetical protein
MCMVDVLVDEYSIELSSLSTLFQSELFDLFLHTGSDGNTARYRLCHALQR